MYIHKLFLLALGCGLFLTASADDEPASASEQLVVSATRWETSGVPVPASIKVISREQIRQSGVDNITEVLQGQGGLQIRDLFGDGSRSIIDMRGFGSSGSANTLILVDGRRINNTDLSSPRLNNIFLKDVERIEITRGSAAVLYGDQAVGGVVNIITRQASGFEVDVEAGFGSFDSQSQTLHVQQRLANGLGLRLSAERSRSDGYRDNNKSSYVNGFLNLSYEGERGRLFTDLQQTNEDLRLPGALTLDQLNTRKQTLFPLDFNDSINKSARVGGSFRLNSDWDVATEYTYRDDDVDGVLTGLNIKQTRRQSSFNPRIRGQVRTLSRTITLVAGADIEDTRYKLVSPFGTQFGDRDMLGIYTLVTVPVNERLSVSGGVRHAWLDRELVDGFRFFPGDSFEDDETATTIGLTYEPNDSLRFFVKREDNFRFPLLDEEMNVFTLSTLLETQTGVSYEGGVEWQAPNWDAGLTLYRMDIDDEINVDPTFFLENINLEETRHSGVIAEANLYLLENLTAGVQYTFTEAEITAGRFNDNDIPLVAEHQIQLQANYEFMPGWQLYGDIFYISDRTAGGDFDGSNETLKGYTVANLHLGYEYQSFSVRARVNNILDKRYNGTASENLFGQVGYFPAPERNFFLTIGYTFN